MREPNHTNFGIVASDDIVARLRQHAEWLSATRTGEVCATAAGEIERLRADGNALANAYRTLGGLDNAHNPALRTWESKHLKTGPELK